MSLSDAEIEAAKTPAGGWTRTQLAAWGVEWPPKKGWRRELVEGKSKMNASSGDLTKIKDRVWDDSTRSGRAHVDSVVQIFEALCESPIEVMLGSSIYLGCSIALGPMVATKLLRVVPDGRFHQGYDGQWVLTPQLRWSRYRIDFALYTKLPYPIFIECDGHDFHERTKEDAQRDREKDRAIQAAGIPILRFTGSEIYRSPQACAFQVFTFASERILPAKTAIAETDATGDRARQRKARDRERQKKAVAG